jgi:hypothetical protein
MILSVQMTEARVRADNVSKLMPPSYPNTCDLHSKTHVQNACFDWILALLEDCFHRRGRTRSERRKTTDNRLAFEPDLLRERSRRHAHDKDAVFDQLDPAVLRDDGIDHGRPELSGAIDKTQVDSSKSTRERIEDVA